MDKASVSQAAAQWLETTMAERRISLNQLASDTGIPRVTLGRRINVAPHDFTVGELERIARVLNVKVSDITGAAEAEAA